MHIIDSIKIIGFWGDKSIDIDFADEINFLIGVNGSGKTTIINLIAGTLNVDFRTLKKHHFLKIRINLKNLENLRIKPYIEVIRQVDKNNFISGLTYKVRMQANKKPLLFQFENFDADYWYRHNEYGYHSLNILGRELRQTLNECFNISWLSIHRTAFDKRELEDQSYESSVDRKIDELSNSFVKYFSKLNKLAAQETEVFQEYIFLSLLSDESEKQIFSILDKINSENEKESLKEIFNLFNLDPKIYSKKLKKHFNSYEESYKKFEEGGISLIDASYLIGTRRIHSVVQEWEKLVEKQNHIYSSRDTFLSVINNLLQRKNLMINDRNELVVETQSGKKLPLKHLSSGEKQLVIILGESLLQELAPHIYIADEPELSLHIGWQEKLVSSLKKLNPNSQIIFATHSPDIVSEYSDYVIQIEDFISNEL